MTLVRRKPAGREEQRKPGFRRELVPHPLRADAVMRMRETEGDPVEAEAFPHEVETVAQLPVPFGLR